MHIDLKLGHSIQWHAGLWSKEQGLAKEHGDARRCVVVCWTALWSGSASHRIEYIWGVTGTLTQVGHRPI